MGPAWRGARALVGDVRKTSVFRSFVLEPPSRMRRISTSAKRRATAAMPGGSGGRPGMALTGECQESPPDGVRAIRGGEPKAASRSSARFHRDLREERLLASGGICFGGRLSASEPCSARDLGRFPVSPACCPGLLWMAVSVRHSLGIQYDLREHSASRDPSRSSARKARSSAPSVAHGRFQ